MSSPEQQQNNEESYDNLVDMHEKVIEDIAQLQDIENEIFNNITELNNPNGDPGKIRQKVERLKDVRINTFNRLTNIYQNTIDNTSFAKDALINNNAMYRVVNDQLTNVSDELKKIKQEMQNKKRMAMIGQYEYSKYREYKNILKLLVYCMIVIAITTVLMSFPFFPNIIGYVIIVIAIAVLVYNLVDRLYFNIRRNNIEYHKFNSGKVPGTESGGTVRKSLSDLFDKKECISPQSLEETYRSVANSGQSSEATESFTLFENFKEGNTKTKPPNTVNDEVKVIAERATAQANARHIGALKGTKAAAQDAAEEAEDAAKSAKLSEIKSKRAERKANAVNRKANALNRKANALNRKANAINRKANYVKRKTKAVNRKANAVNRKANALEKRLTALEKKSPFTLLKNVFQSKKQEEDKIMETQKTLQRKQKRENLYKKKLIMLDSYNYDDNHRYYHI